MKKKINTTQENNNDFEELWQRLDNNLNSVIISKKRGELTKFVFIFSFLYYLVSPNSFSTPTIIIIFVSVNFAANISLYFLKQKTKHNDFASLTEYINNKQICNNIKKEISIGYLDDSKILDYTKTEISKLGKKPSDEEIFFNSFLKYLRAEQNRGNHYVTQYLKNAARIETKGKKGKKGKKKEEKQQLNPNIKLIEEVEKEHSDQKREKEHSDQEVEEHSDQEVEEHSDQEAEEHSDQKRGKEHSDQEAEEHSDQKRGKEYSDQEAEEHFDQKEEIKLNPHHSSREDSSTKGNLNLDLKTLNQENSSSIKGTEKTKSQKKTQTPKTRKNKPSLKNESDYNAFDLEMKEKEKRKAQANLRKKEEALKLREKEEKRVEEAAKKAAEEARRVKQEEEKKRLKEARRVEQEEEKKREEARRVKQEEEKKREEARRVQQEEDTISTILREVLECMTKEIETKAAIESKIIIDKFQPFLSEDERQKKFEQLFQLAEKYNRYDINSFLLEDLEAQIYQKCQNQLGFFLAESLVEIHNKSPYGTLLKEINSLKQYFANTTIIAKTSKMNNFNPKWMILYEDELKTAKNIFQELWNKVSPCFMSVKGSAPFKQEKNPNGDIDICYFFPANSKMGKIQDILKKYGLDKHLKVGQINGHSIISCKGAQLEGAQLDVSCYTSPTLPLLNNYSASSGTSNPTSWQESKKTERNPTLHFLYVGNDSFLPYENRNIYSHIQELQKKIAIQENKYQESPIKSRFLKADEYSKINSSYEEARRIIESLDRNRRQRPQIQRSFSKSNLQNEVTTTPPSIFALDAENNESEYTGNKRVG